VSFVSYNDPSCPRILQDCSGQASILGDSSIGQCQKQVHFFLFFNYTQQDATIFHYLFLKDSTCFGRFLLPSSGAHNLYIQLYCQPIVLQAGIVDVMELTWYRGCDGTDLVSWMGWNWLGIVDGMELAWYRG